MGLKSELEDVQSDLETIGLDIESTQADIDEIDSEIKQLETDKTYEIDKLWTLKKDEESHLSRKIDLEEQIQYIEGRIEELEAEIDIRSEDNLPVQDLQDELTKLKEQLN